MNLIFLMFFSIIGCYHDINQDSGDTAEAEPVPAGGSSSVYCYSEEPPTEIPASHDDR
jgi:hypothetical protein